MFVIYETTFGDAPESIKQRKNIWMSKHLHAKGMPQQKFSLYFQLNANEM